MSQLKVRHKPSVTNITSLAWPPQCLSTLLMLCTSDMYTLINYVGFINYLFYGVTVAGQIVLRIKQPDLHRPIQVGLYYTTSVHIELQMILFIRLNTFLTRGNRNNYFFFGLFSHIIYNFLSAV